MSKPTPLRAAIASDQGIFRRGLASLVMSIKGAQLVGEARDPAEALQLCELLQPGLLILDFKISFEAGNDLAARIHQRWPRQVVILMVGSQEEGQLPSLSEANTYTFSRDISEEEFAAAIKHIGQERQPSVGVANSQEEVSPPVEEERPRRTGPPVMLATGPASPADGEILMRELVMAGKIQSDILPEKPPAIPGWDLSARLESARETSGDFYDFIPLPNGHWGIVIADVTDKGMGAALFMALSSTLIRTYAARYPTLPALTIDVVNERILTDTRGGMFVSAFYGILEPHTGRFRYVNAGHPPVCLVSHQKGKKPVDRLVPTGMALGLMERAQWQQKMCRLYPGDVLLFYTDGITEAQNKHDVFFGEARLMEVLRSKSHLSAQEIQNAVLDAVHKFVDDAAPQDDIAIIVLKQQDLS
jgi:DNA-binding NarL/FixJ family response regulator